MTRPYVLLSVATSIDGCIDDTTPERLRLSNADDFDRVDQVRAASDAILIGAETMRRDNPRLLVNSEERRARRVADGLPAFPLKVTVTRSGNLDAGLNFWHHGGAKLVYTVDAAAKAVAAELDGLADVVPLGDDLEFGRLLDDLGQRGISRLMVEGGGQIHTAFLSASLADEIHLVVAPLLVGNQAAPHFLNPAAYPGGSTRRMHLEEVRQIGDVVLLRYFPKRESGTAG